MALIFQRTQACKVSWKIALSIRLNKLKLPRTFDTNGKDQTQNAPWQTKQADRVFAKVAWKSISKAIWTRVRPWAAARRHSHHVFMSNRECDANSQSAFASPGGGAVTQSVGLAVACFAFCLSVTISNIHCFGGGGGTAGNLLPRKVLFNRARHSWAG